MAKLIKSTRLLGVLIHKGRGLYVIPKLDFDGETRFSIPEAENISPRDNAYEKLKKAFVEQTGLEFIGMEPINFYHDDFYDRRHDIKRIILGHEIYAKTPLKYDGKYLSYSQITSPELMVRSNRRIVTSPEFKRVMLSRA